MGRNIAAGVAGVVIAVVLITIVEKLGHTVYPPPADLDFANPDQMRSYTSSLPIGALLFVVGAWFVGTLGGTVAACRIGTAKPTTFAMIVGGLILVATVVNLVMIPHPTWFAIVGVSGVIAAAYLGSVLGKSVEGDRAG